MCIISPNQTTRKFLMQWEVEWAPVWQHSCMLLFGLIYVYAHMVSVIFIICIIYIPFLIALCFLLFIVLFCYVVKHVTLLKHFKDLRKISIISWRFELEILWNYFQQCLFQKDFFIVYSNIKMNNEFLWRYYSHWKWD